jgi:hypothetical protein
MFGEALSSGKGVTIIKSLGLLIALTAVTHLLRRHLSQKKAAA